MIHDGMTDSVTYLEVLMFFFILWVKGKGKDEDKDKDKTSTVQAWTGPEGSRRLGLSDFHIVST
jgi:hypothetical protein